VIARGIYSSRTQNGERKSTAHPRIRSDGIFKTFQPCGTRPGIIVENSQELSSSRQIPLLGCTAVAFVSREPEIVDIWKVADKLFCFVA
jgi:hypothetical protein